MKKPAQPKAAEPSADLLSAIENDTPMASPDKIDAVKRAVHELLFAQDRLRELNEEVSSAKDLVKSLVEVKLPELLDLAGTPALTIAAAGNMPAVELEVRPFYAANIAASWEEEKRAAAFDYLVKIGSASLIKTELRISFEKEEHKKAIALVKELRKKGYNVEISSSIHSATLTSWLKNQVEKVRKMPDLEKIGGFVGRKAKVKVL